MKRTTQDLIADFPDSVLGGRAANYCKTRWAGQRSELANIAYVLDFVQFCELIGVRHAPHLLAEQVADYMKTYVSLGYSPSSLNTRASIVKGLLVAIGRPDIKVTFWSRSATEAKKWFLSDPDAAKLISELLKISSATYAATAASIPLSRNEARLFNAYLVFTIETGLRVEEVLRLVPEDFDLHDINRPALFVPGTKTIASADRIGISLIAGAAAEERITLAKSRATSYDVKAGPLPMRLFDIEYRRLYEMWEKCRTWLQLDHVEGATLKGLRRTFAARCLRKGIPVETIRSLMRHSNLETTLGYLKLFGLTDNDETRALLNKQLGSGDGTLEWRWARFPEAARVVLDLDGYNAERVRAGQPPVDGFDEPDWFRERVGPPTITMAGRSFVISEENIERIAKAMSESLIRGGRR